MHHVKSENFPSYNMNLYVAMTWNYENWQLKTMKSIRLYRREDDQQSAEGKPHHIITRKHGMLWPNLLCYNLISFHISVGYVSHLKMINITLMWHISR